MGNRKQAVWIKNTKIDFFDSLQEDKYGGTICKNKSTGNVDYSRSITVDAIDFSKWVEEKISESDYVILKIDIEGAEYEVLSKMIEDGSIAKINLLFIEWHANKINVDFKYHLSLKKKIESLGLVPYDWHAAEYI